MTEQPDRSESSDPDIQKRDLVMELVAVTQRLGHLPSAADVNKHAEYSHQRYREEFGDLFQAFKTAGIIPDSAMRSDLEQLEAAEERDESSSAEGASSETSTQSPSREELIDELKRLEASLDRLPYASDMDEEGNFSAYIYQDRFGSWDEALDAAGIDKEAVLLKDLQRVAEKLDKTPAQPDVNKHSTYSAGMYARYFGSWSAAKERFREWQTGSEQESERDEVGTEKEAVVSDGDQDKVPSRDELRAELNRVYDVVDRLPHPSDMNEIGTFSAAQYQNRFDSWNDALAAAGIDKETELLEEIGRVTEKVGRVPSQSEMNEHGQFSATMAANFFGSWSRAKDRFEECRGEQPSVKHVSDETSEEDVLSQEDLLDALVEVAELVGDTPTRSDMIKHCEYPLHLYGEVFGSLEDAIEKAELQEDKLESGPFDQDKLLEEIIRFADVLDAPPSRELIEKYGRYSIDDYQDCFGSWDAALQEAGLRTEDMPDRSNWKYSNVDVLDAITEVAAIVGHPPTTSDMNQYGTISHTTCTNRFGSWETALEMAGLDPSQRPGVPDKTTTKDETGPKYTDGDVIEEYGRRQRSGCPSRSLDW